VHSYVITHIERELCAFRGVPFCELVGGCVLATYRDVALQTRQGVVGVGIGFTRKSRPSPRRASSRRCPSGSH
jgi:hypothetical protein